MSHVSRHSHIANMLKVATCLPVWIREKVNDPESLDGNPGRKRQLLFFRIEKTQI